MIIIANKENNKNMNSKNNKRGGSSAQDDRTIAGTSHDTGKVVRSDS